MLADSLICLIVTVSICLLLQMLASSVTRYEDGYRSFLKRTDEGLEEIFRDAYGCQGCLIDGSD